MKNLTLSFFLVLFVAAHVAHAAITCSEVDMKAASCVTYAQGKVPAVPTACCNGLKALVQKAATVTDRRSICSCLKDGVKKFPGVKDAMLGKIPGVCNIKVGFPVSMGTNCNAIN